MPFLPPLAGRLRELYPVPGSLRPASVSARPLAGARHGEATADSSAMAARAFSSCPCPDAGDVRSGAAEGTRTPDPIITNDVLYQLSYSGVPDRGGSAPYMTRHQAAVPAARSRSGCLPIRLAVPALCEGPDGRNPVCSDRTLPRERRCRTTGPSRWPCDSGQAGGAQEALRPPSPLRAGACGSVFRAPQRDR